MMNNLVIVTSIVAFVLVLSVSHRVAQAGPLHHEAATMELFQTLHRTKREIYPEIMDDQPLSLEKATEDQAQQICVVGDLVYEADELVPAEQPCLKCKCQPPGVHCETTRCEKKPGCRAIHKPNTCCPEYQCECDYEGRTYANGERLEQKPGTECKVCYCRGGEVQCAEVSCYIRNDCEGRHVPGKCCPKYDHCPPKEPSNVFFANEINDTNKSTIKILGDIVHPAANQRQPDEQEVEEAHQEITIHEIIPEIKEIPITNSPKREINDVVHKQLIVGGTHNSDEGNNSGSNDLVHNTDSDSNGSEVAEVYQHPPSVLRIGDKLLFLKKDGELVNEKGISTPATVITIIGAEGLQRGGIEAEEILEPNNDIKQGTEKSVTSFEDVLEEQNEDDIQTVAESTYILSLVKRPSSTTESILEIPDVFNSRLDDIESGNFTEISASSSDVEDISSATDTFDELVGNVTNSCIDGETDDNIENPENSTIHSTSLAESSFLSTSSTPTSILMIHEKEEVLEFNPEYPPIPDVMTQQVEEDAGPTADVNPPQGKNFLEVFEPAVATNSTQNESNATWLKKTLLNPAATLPESILTSVAESDLSTTAATRPDALEDESGNVEDEIATTTEDPATTITATSVGISETTFATARSKETMESIEDVTNSGEEVTVKQDHASILNDESNASVESVGMTGTLVSGEESTAELVEMLPGFSNVTSETVESSSIDTPEIKHPDDVEMIDVDLMRGHNSDETAKNSTHEGVQNTESTQNPIVSYDKSRSRKTIKRESNEDESIFEELNREIGLDSGTIVEDEPQEQSAEEAKHIFKELVDEATSGTTAKPVNLQGTATPQTRQQHQQAVALARIGDALAKLQLKDSKKGVGVNTDVLGILRDFFTAQYRAYN